MSCHTHIYIFFGWIFLEEDPGDCLLTPQGVRVLSPDWKKLHDIYLEGDELSDHHRINCESQGDDLILYPRESIISGTCETLKGSIFDQRHRPLVVDPTWEPRLQALLKLLGIEVLIPPSWHVGWDQG